MPPGGRRHPCRRRGVGDRGRRASFARLQVDQLEAIPRSIGRNQVTRREAVIGTPGEERPLLDYSHTSAEKLPVGAVEVEHPRFRIFVPRSADLVLATFERDPVAVEGSPLPCWKKQRSHQSKNPRIPPARWRSDRFLASRAFS